MGQKPAGPGNDFNARVIEELERRMSEIGVTKRDLIANKVFPSNSLYRKMRGDQPFNLNEIETLAKALNSDPILLLRAAAVGTPAQTHSPSGDNRGEVVDMFSAPGRRVPKVTPAKRAARKRTGNNGAHDAGSDGRS